MAINAREWSILRPSKQQVGGSSPSGHAKKTNKFRVMTFQDAAKLECRKTLRTIFYGLWISVRWMLCVLLDNHIDEAKVTVGGINLASNVPKIVIWHRAYVK